MTEVEKVYYDDIREKKIINHSANKVNRTGKGPIRFPSDYLSKKEREQMNGECRSWNLNGFYSWDEFKQMPNDIKISWLNRMLNVYGVGIKNIETVVFNGRTNILVTWLNRHAEVKKYVNAPGRGGHTPKSAAEKFAAAVESWRTTQITMSETPETNDDWTPAERDFITRFIAPLSEPKKEESETATIEINPEEVANSTSVTEETDDSILYASTPTELPKMSHMEFGMDGFDLNFLRMVAERFGDQKVRVCISVYVENNIDE